MSAYPYPKTSKEDWKLAINHKVISKNVKRVVQESWLRCLEKNVDPFAPTNLQVLSAQELTARWELRQELLDTCLPFIEKLYTLVKGSGSVVSLSDSEGFLLKIIGDTAAHEFGNLSNFVEGACWLENVMGTNAIGTSLITGEAIQIIGYEHWSLSSHNATCSGAPIRDPEGNIIAVLDITAPKEKAHPHTLGLVAAAAYAIENQMKLKRSFESSRAIIESITDGLLVIDGQNRVSHLNNAVVRLLGCQPQDVIGLPLKQLIDEQYNSRLLNIILNKCPVTDELFLLHKNDNIVKCTITVRPLTNPKNETIGTVVIINEHKRIKHLIKQMEGTRASLTFANIVGSSPNFLAAVKMAKMVSASHSTILLSGESGTGKDVFAQAIHNNGPRTKQPFVALNCGAIPRELMASELFGHVEGAFTGARKGGTPGKFELADGGTIFLDEISEIPLDLQAHLLRVIEDKSIVRLGGTEVIPLDIRIIAATNRNLEEEVAKKNFRADLYYRLNVVSIHLPPLRERLGDIPALTTAFANQLAAQWGKKTVTIDDEAMLALQFYQWPGNIRELQNVLERIFNFLDMDQIRLEHLSAKIVEGYRATNSTPNTGFLRKSEMVMIMGALQRNRGNRSQAALDLGISRSTLYRKIQEYNIDNEALENHA